MSLKQLCNFSCIVNFIDKTAIDCLCSLKIFRTMDLLLDEQIAHSTIFYLIRLFEAFFLVIL